MVHTTESMQRAKDVITSLPPGAGEDFSYGTEGDEEFIDDEDEYDTDLCSE